MLIILGLMLSACVVVDVASAAPPSTLASLSAALPDTVSLDDKVVYVDFWASWCVPCRKSFPWMEGAAEKYASDGLQIIAVNLDRKEEAARSFLAEFDVSFPIVFNPKGDLAKSFELNAMPTALIFRRDGTLARRHEGFRAKDAAELEQFLAKLLTEEDPE